MDAEIFSTHSVNTEGVKAGRVSANHTKWGAIKSFPRKVSALALPQDLRRGARSWPWVSPVPAAAPRRTNFFSPASIVACSKCPHLIQLSWWKRPVFFRVEAAVVSIPQWEQWQDRQSEPSGLAAGCIAAYQISLPVWLCIAQSLTVDRLFSLFLWKFVLKCIFAQVKTLSAKFHPENIFAAKL